MTSRPACPACATPAAPSARFCGACGAALPVGCPACGAETVAGQAFCTECGAALGPGPRRRADERRRGEERRVVSVLFVDVVGWTSAAERLDPEDLRAAQSDYFAAVRAVIEETGGTLEKYVGDAVLACYGAPRATEDDALRAVRAALLIQDALAELVVGDEPLAGRVGVATSEALVDLDADPARGQAFVTGDVVNLASRFESAAPPGGVLVGQDTYTATADSVEYEPVGPLQLKGKAEPVVAYLARGMSAKSRSPGRVTRSRSSAGSAGPAARDLPRSGHRRWRRRPGDHHRRARDRQEPARARAPQGPRRLRRGSHERIRRRHPASTGSRRRASPSTTRAATRRWPHCFPAGARSNAPSEAGTPEQAASVLRQQISERLPRLDAQRVVEALGPLLGHASPTPGWTGARRRRSRRRLASHHDRAGRGVPHRAGAGRPAARRRRLARRRGGAARAGDGGAAARSSSRPGPSCSSGARGWGSSTHDIVTLNLPPLDEQETVQLLCRPARRRRSAAALARLVALAGGNPLYAEECAGMLREREAAQLVRGIPELPLPRSVQGIVASRLDLVSDDERAVLQAASVLGDSCWPGPVALLAELPGSEVEVCLAQLARRGMLRRVRPSSVPGEPEYVFRSALVRELVYSRLPRPRRLEQHVRAADWWATRSGRREAERAELVAHHRVFASELASALRAPRLPCAPSRPGWRCAKLQSARTCCGRCFRRGPSGAGARPLADRGRPGGPPVVPAPVRGGVLPCRSRRFRQGRRPARVAAVAAALSALGADTEAARAHTLLGQVAWWVADRTEALEQHGRAVDLLSWPSAWGAAGPGPHRAGPAADALRALADAIGPVTRPSASRNGSD